MKTFLTWWDSKLSWWSSRSLAWWVNHLTALYVGAAILVMAARFDELLKLDLNELGDFSAGVFGPIAFVWLITGYIQQGHELRLSSNALSAQAEEMKHSALRQDRLADPDLVITHIGFAGSGAEPHDVFSIENFGESCRELSVSFIPAFNPDKAAIQHQDVAAGNLARGAQCSFVLSEPAQHGGLMVIKYVRKTGTYGRVGFVITKMLSGIHILPAADRVLEDCLKAPTLA